MRLNFHEEHPFWWFQNPPILVPMVPVRLWGKRGLAVDTYALLDSGADVSMFNARWASRIGLVLEDGREEFIGGIGKETELRCYVHRIDLTIGSNRIRTEVAFSAELGDEVTDQLVGRQGVFDAMRFALRQKVEKLYIGSVP